jgi:thiol:disulfide interchange protein DsbD
VRRSRLALLSLLLAVVSQAQLSSLSGGAPGIPSQPLVTLSGGVQSRSGDEVHGTLNATILSGWHINSNKPLTEFSIPTVLVLDSATAELVSAQYPAHELRTFAFSGDEKIAVYEGAIAIPFAAKLKNNAAAIKASLKYQACNDSVCLPPRTADIDISAAVVAGAATPAPTTGSTGGSTGGFTRLGDAPKTPAGGPAIGNDKISAAFAAHGLPLTLLLLFIGGLALNLTPCVLPMVPITTGFFAMQSDGRRSRRFLLSLAYVAGLVLMYASLGLVAAASGALFGAWLQKTAVLVGLAVLMLVLASSMFGVWEMTVPQFISKRSGGRAGYAGAAIMGLFVGIVAAPCVGPIVAALFILVASIGKPLIGFVMFATLGFGLGFPYLVALSFLPKPGEWMVQFKRALGFILIAEAFYFLRPVIGDAWYHYGVAASLLVGALFLFLVRSGGARAVRLTFAAVLLLFGIWFAVPPKKGAEEKVAWQKYAPASITAAAPLKKPVIIDFYADWCLPCKELDAKTFSDDGVARELDRYVRIKANLTNDQDPEVQKLTKDYAIVGVPTIVLIDSSGKEATAQRLTGFEEPKPFLERLRQVR